MKTFEEIGREVDTDKVTHHGYHRYYPIFLEKYRRQDIKLLEIGIYKEKSLRLWGKYFPKAKIFGIEKVGGFKFKRGEVFQGDQSDKTFLKSVVNKIGNKVDFILDDGSHVPEHQIFTFNYLFEHLLKDGGVYIVEDIETSYWRHGICNGYTITNGYKNKQAVTEIFKNVIDQMNVEFLVNKAELESSPISIKVRNKIGMISFQYNTIVILKKDKGYKKYENREYRYKRYL